MKMSLRGHGSGRRVHRSGWRLDVRVRAGRSLTALVPALATLALSGCGDIFGDRDAHQPGTPLGTFHAVGTLSENTCGEGALGATQRWEFDVDLARDGGAFFWDNGATQIPGALADDGVSFTVEGRVVVNMRGQGMPPGPPCSIERRDVARGELSAATEPVDRFTATLSYAFAPTAGSRCDNLVVGGLDPDPGFDIEEGAAAGPASPGRIAALPCRMTYELEAHRR